MTYVCFDMALVEQQSQDVAIYIIDSQFITRAYHNSTHNFLCLLVWSRSYNLPLNCLEYPHALMEAFSCHPPVFLNAQKVDQKKGW